MAPVPPQLESPTIEYGCIALLQSGTAPEAVLCRMVGQIARKLAVVPFARMGLAEMALLHQRSASDQNPTQRFLAPPLTWPHGVLTDSVGCRPSRTPSRSSGRHVRPFFRVSIIHGLAAASRTA